MKKIRWGLLGAGIILNRWMQGALQAEGMEIRAIASRTPDSARKMAEKWKIDTVLTYEEMLERDDIDVVDIPVPHTAHKDLAIRAMKAHKHVLVEKPAAVCADDFREMADCARKNDIFLMEADWTYFFPAIEFLRRCIAGAFWTWASTTCIWRRSCMERTRCPSADMPRWIRIIFICRWTSRRRSSPSMTKASLP